MGDKRKISKAEAVWRAKRDALSNVMWAAHDGIWRNRSAALDGSKTMEERTAALLRIDALREMHDVMLKSLRERYPEIIYECDRGWTHQTYAQHLKNTREAQRG